MTVNADTTQSKALRLRLAHGMRFFSNIQKAKSLASKRHIRLPGSMPLAGLLAPFLALALGLIATSHTSCSLQTKNDSAESAPHAGIDEALALANQIELEVQKGNMLVDMPDREKSAFTSSLERVKIGLIVLKQDPSNKASVDFLSDASYTFKNGPVYEKDLTLVDLLIAKLGEIVAPTIFIAEFEQDLSGFQQLPVVGKAEWKVEQGRGYVKISGFKLGVNENWLVSPIFDLTKAREPALILRQAISHLPDWSYLQVLVSQDFDGTKPPSEATWQALSLPELPSLSKNWDFVTSGEVDLSPWQDQPFVIAFKYISDDAAPSWELEYAKIKAAPGSEFNIKTWDALLLDLPHKSSKPGDKDSSSDKNSGGGTSDSNKSDGGKSNGASDDATKKDEKGTGSDPADKDKKDDPTKTPSDGSGQTTMPEGAVFFEGFDEKNSLGQFKAYSAKGTATWKQSVFKQNKFASMNAYQNGANHDWLVSPLIDLKDVTSPKLSLMQEYGYYQEDVINWSIRISTDFQGGNPEDATWKELPFANLPKKTKPTDSFSAWQETEALDLSAYKETPFVIGFYYHNDETSPRWDIDWVKIQGEGTIATSPLELDASAE